MNCQSCRHYHGHCTHPAAMAFDPGDGSGCYNYSPQKLLPAWYYAQDAAERLERAERERYEYDLRRYTANCRGGCK